jgi:asparagine synthase (glutamine-hydrolysing)
MCGITAVINRGSLTVQDIEKANALIAHRGPDDEGFLSWSLGAAMQSFAGKDTSDKSCRHYQLKSLTPEDQYWTVALAHRRLAILDLSPKGHQPMMHSNRWAITYNGEVYNYIELRSELQALGHVFDSDTDTEVILHAWEQWGVEALHKFNGMFAFVLVDTVLNKLYAVRDRFGIKPLYYTHTEGYTAFVSEAKQLRCLPGYSFTLNMQVAFDYLRYGRSDHGANTFEEGIYQLLPGHYMEVDLDSKSSNVHCWYELKPSEWHGTDEQAIKTFQDLLADSVRLQMRSDVSIGSALSGGLDSSVIVCLMREVLNEQGNTNLPIQSISSCSLDKRYDEWEYAEEVVKHKGVEATQVFPAFENLKKEFDQVLWHMDYPFTSSSQYSQWSVFSEAQSRGIKVMLNGQGADEQLAGYRGNDMFLYIGLLNQFKFVELIKEINAFKNYKGTWPIGYMVGAVQQQLPSSIRALIPARFKVIKTHLPDWLSDKGLKRVVVEHPRSLNESLKNQVLRDPLPSLLRFEDRISMAFSIESRVPFMDHRLVEFTLGLPEHLVYRRGERKYILRHAFAAIVPEKIIQRKDKLGYASAEETWMKGEGAEWFEKLVDQAGKYSAGFIHHDVAGSIAFNFDPWRMICFSKWLIEITKKSIDPSAGIPEKYLV